MAVSGITKDISPSVVLHTWDTFTASGFGVAVDMSRYEERTFSVGGTASSAVMELWGSNTVSTPTTGATGLWGQLHTYGGNLVSGQANYVILVLDNPRYIAPYFNRTTTGAVSVDTSILARG